MSILRFWQLGSVCLLVWTQTAHSIVALTAQELILHCQAFPEQIESTDGQYCIRYVQGFIDGAIATDERVMENVEAEYGRKEDFSERAARTRGARDRAAAYAEFCLGDPVPLREVVANVVNDLNDRKYTEEGVAARDVVYASLRKHFPCKQPAQQD